jgi:hypothetical protein
MGDITCAIRSPTPFVTEEWIAAVFGAEMTPAQRALTRIFRRTHRRGLGGRLDRHYDANA